MWGTLGVIILALLAVALDVWPKISPLSQLLIGFGMLLVFVVDLLSDMRRSLR